MFLLSPAANAIVNRLSFTVAMRAVQLLLRAQGIGIGDDVAGSGEQRVFEIISAAAPVLFDVGGHLGKYADAFINYFPHSEVFLFEPSASHISIAKNSLKGNVHFFNVALSDREKTAVLYKDAEISGLASLSRRNLDHRNIKMDLMETVRCRTLDAVVADEGVNHIDLLKIDVEGHELEVLNGGRDTLESGKVGLVQFEFGGCNIDTRTQLRDFFQFFRPIGYSLYLVRPHGGLAPLKQYHELYEQYQTSNYLAMRSDDLY